MATSFKLGILNEISVTCKVPRSAHEYTESTVAPHMPNWSVCLDVHLNSQAYRKHFHILICISDLTIENTGGLKA